MKKSAANKTILLVEDEAIIALDEKETLEKRGYRVIVTYSGKKAINLFERETNIDLILMDIDLGAGIDGPTAAKEILGLRDVPIIFLSSHSEPEIIKKTENITSYGYAGKNYDIEIIDASIKMALKLFEAHEELRQKKSSLSKNQKLLNSIAENLPNSYIAIVERDFTVSFAAGREFKKNGAELNSYVGKDLRSIFGERYDKVKYCFEKTFNGEECSIELETVKSAMRIFTVPLYTGDGEIENILAVAENISDYKKSEKELEEAQRINSSLLSNMPGMGYRCINERGWKMDFVSAGAKDLTGYEIKEISGGGPIDYGDMIHPEDRQMVWDSIQEAISKKNRYTLEYRITTKNQIDKWVWEQGWEVVPIGKSEAMLEGFIIDITARKRAQDKIEKLLEERNILLKEIHHRVKNNMLIIRSLLSMHLETLDSGPALTTLKKAIGQVESMKLLYEKLYDRELYSEISASDYFPQLIDDISAIFSDEIPIKLEKEIDDFILTSKTTFTLGIILNELMINAMKYAFIDKTKGKIRISIKCADEQVTFIFEDNGVGIKEEEIGQTGRIGLTMISYLVEELGGTFNTVRQNGTRNIINFRL